MGAGCGLPISPGGRGVQGLAPELELPLGVECRSASWMEGLLEMKWNTAWIALLVAYGSLFACEPRPADDTDEDTSSGGAASGGQGTGGGAAGGQATGGDAPVLGERGSSCDASSDCEEGLSCIVTAGCPVGLACANKTCQPSNFEIMGTGKQCHIVQCAEREDCCGDMPLEAPEKCDIRNITCNQPTLPGCSTVVCTEDSACGAGNCTGYCNYDTEVECMTADDCEENVCVFSGGSGGSGSGGAGSGGAGSGGAGSGGGGSGGTSSGGAGSGGSASIGSCSVTGTTCYDTNDCVTNSCSTVYCRCENPDYDPTDPICEDTDCEGICGWDCQNDRCVVDTSCNIDEDCLGATPFCDDGLCVECLNDDDCEEEDCIAGRCGPECEADAQCGLFEVCQDDACVYVGCQTNRECVLAAEGGASEQDPRLSVCMIEEGVGTCVFPCEIDAQCAPTEICVDSVCEYIGCETDGECKTIEGLHDQPPPTEEQPWTTTAECRADPAE